MNPGSLAWRIEIAANESLLTPKIETNLICWIRRKYNWNTRLYEKGNGGSTLAR